MIDGLIAHNLLGNLITTHPPLQLDGNFGIVAGISEMLLQSHTGCIQLLPGVDLTTWPRGRFDGLRARGAFEVSVRWDVEELVAEVLSLKGEPAHVRAKRSAVSVVDSADQAVKFEARDGGGARFETRVGERYRVVFG